MSHKHTVLYDEHVRLGAKMIDFGGWTMPASYQSVISEHLAVRSRCGLFDVSHMGEIFVEGPDAKAFLQYVTINNLERISLNKGQYSALLNEEGGMIDDLILYQLDDHKYLLCVNASNIEKDFDWLMKQSKGFDCKVTNQSEAYAQIAIQGPLATGVVVSIAEAIDQGAIQHMRYMDIRPIVLFGKTCLLARTGYTGELGFELYLPKDIAVSVWRALLTSKSTEVVAAGLGARDTLRLEACYLLYGNDMDDNVTPYEAGIGWAVRLDKDFIGKDALIKRKEGGSGRKMIAFKLDDKGIPRSGMDVYAGEEWIGRVTSGSMLPTLEFPGGMALVKESKADLGETIEVDIRGKRKLAKVMKRPLYSAKVK